VPPTGATLAVAGALEVAAPATVAATEAAAETALEGWDPIDAGGALAPELQAAITRPRIAMDIGRKMPDRRGCIVFLRLPGRLALRAHQPRPGSSVAPP
jgi:hypothetical protein